MAAAIARVSSALIADERARLLVYNRVCVGYGIRLLPGLYRPMSNHVPLFNKSYLDKKSPETSGLLHVNQQVKLLVASCQRQTRHRTVTVDTDVVRGCSWVGEGTSFSITCFVRTAVVSA